MKKFKVLVILFLIISNLHSQSIIKKDSLIGLISFKKDTALVKLYINIGREYFYFDTDSSKIFYEKAKILIRKLNYKEGEIELLPYYSQLLQSQGDYENDLQLNLRMLKLANSLKNEKYISKVYGNLGNSYRFNGNYKKSIECYLKSIKYFEKIKDQKTIINSYINIANVYDDTKQYNKALEYYNLAEKIALINNRKDLLIVIYTNKGSNLISQNKLKDAEIAITNGLSLSKSTKNDYLCMANLVNLTGLKIKLKQNNEVRKYAKETLYFSNKLINVEAKCMAYRDLSISYLYDKNYVLAKKYLFIALKISKENKISYLNAELFKLLSDVHLANQEINEYIYYRDKTDSVLTVQNLEEVNNKISELETKYQTEKKELQIKTLTQQNELQDLKIKRRLWTTITLFLALLGLGAFAYSQFKNFKTKKELLLAQQDNAIAEERLRIASDMHDDVGSGLSRIRYIVGAIANGQTEQKQGLTKVTEISDDAVQKMKEIIWSLNESNQNLEDLIYYIRGQMSEMVENGNVKFVCHLPENIPSVFFGWKRNRNTYLLVKESINNAIKHADAKTITLDFDIANDLKIKVSDDGKGFDTNKNFTGNGLNNYKKRIADLNAKYELKSEIDKGTTFWFQLSISNS